MKQDILTEKMKDQKSKWGKYWLMEEPRFLGDLNFIAEWLFVILSTVSNEGRWSIVENTYNLKPKDAFEKQKAHKRNK